jgi:hypothetical protein
VGQWEWGEGRASGSGMRMGQWEWGEDGRVGVG